MLFKLKEKVKTGDFPRGSAVKISPPSARGTSSIPGWAAKICLLAKKKKANKCKTSNIVTNSVKI